MPEIDLSGEVFGADAGAGFDEGLVRGDVGGDARVDYATRFELCHGLSGEVSADVAIAAAAELGLLWLVAAGADGQALAAAGLQLDLQVTTDVFDRVGVSAELAAFAELAVAGRLSVGFDLRDVVAAARQVLSGAALEVFLALLREVSIEAGVWGKLSLSAAAKVRMNLRGSLAADRDAGFVLEHGAEAGLGAGAGYDFYAGVRFTNPKRFFLVAIDVVTGEILAHARRVAPQAMRPALGALEFVLPSCLAAAYELGQLAAANLAADPTEAGRVFVDCLLAELQRFALDKLGMAALGVVGDTVIDLAARAAHALSGQARRSAAAAIDTLIALVAGRPLDLATATDVVDGLTPVLDAVAGPARATWRTALSVLWLAVAAAEAIRQGVTSHHVSASVGLIGLGTAAEGGSTLTLHGLPAIVQEELAAQLGTPVTDELSLDAAVDALLRSQVLPVAMRVAPEATVMLELLAHELGITASAVLELAVRATGRADLTQTQLYRALRSVAGRVLDDLVTDELLPALGALLGTGSDARIWIDEVAGPALAMMRNLVLGRLDDMVATGGASPGSVDTFRTALSLMVSKIVLSNVVVLGDILHQHVTVSVSAAAAELAREVRMDPRGAVTTGMVQLARSAFPMRPPPDIADAAGDLAAEMLLALSDATADGVVTPADRAQVRELTRRLLFSVFGEADLATADGAESFVAEVAACAYLPNPETLVELLALQAAIAGRELGVAMPRITAALVAFATRISPVAAIEQAVADQLEEWRQDAIELGREVLEIGNAVRDTALAVAAAADDQAAEIEAAAAALRQPQRRAEILARLRLQGALTAAETARAVPIVGDVDAAVDVAVASFHVLFDLAAPLLDIALQAIAPLADGLATLVEGVGDLAELVAELAQLVVDAVEDALDNLTELELPNELGVADVTAAAAAVVTELPVIRDALAAALGHRRDGAFLEAKQRSLAKKAASVARAKAERERARQRIVATGRAALTLCSPQQQGADRHDIRAYGAAVPLHLAVTGAVVIDRRARNAPRQLVVTVNGKQASIPAGSWTYDEQRSRLTVTHTLTAANSGLRTGLNIVECGYADGVHPAVRATATFLADLAALDEDVETDAAGDRLVVRPDRAPVRLDGWRVVDSAGGSVRLSGTVAVGGRRELPSITPQPGRTPAASPCGPSVVLVDPRGRRRGELRRNP